MPIHVPPLTREWFEVSLTCDHIWTRFIAQWIAFNAFYDARFNDGGDRKKVDAACGDQELRAIHLELLNDNDYQASVVWFVHRPGVVDMRMGNRQLVDGPDDWAGFLRCLYQVRNNLFHADKSLESAEDERVLRHASRAAHELIQSLIAKHVD